MDNEGSCRFYGKVPIDIDNVELCGVEVDTKLKCRHGLQPVRRVAFEGTDTGRRFISCCIEDADRCDFICWYEPEWPMTMKNALQALWKKLDEKEQNMYREIDSLLNHMLHEKLKAEKEKEDVETEIAGIVAEFEEKLQVMRTTVEKKNKWFMISVSCNVVMLGVLASVFALKT